MPSPAILTSVVALGLVIFAVLAFAFRGPPMIPGWVALLALLLNVAGGAWIAYRYGYRDGLEEANEPICGCGHHRAFHKGVGECAWHPDGHSTLVCPCQGYIGPEAVPEFLWPHVEKEADK